MTADHLVLLLRALAHIFARCGQKGCEDRPPWGGEALSQCCMVLWCACRADTQWAALLRVLATLPSRSSARVYSRRVMHPHPAKPGPQSAVQIVCHLITAPPFDTLIRADDLL